MIRSIRTHTARILRTLPAQITFLLLFGLVLYNFIRNVIVNAGIQYVSQMTDPLKLLTLSHISEHEGSQAGHILMLLYPILVVFPVSATWLTDKSTGNVNFIESRSGRRNFWFGKFIAVFLSTFIIFAGPFFLELLLNTICFDLSSDGQFGSSFIQGLQYELKYAFPRLWGKSRYLYVVVMQILWGAASGVLACFSFACSTFPFMRYRILNFIPVYVFLYSGTLIQSAFQTKTVLNYTVIFRMFFFTYTQEMNNLLYFACMAALLLVSVVIILIKSRKDQLS
ncbi:MAG: hypothetical protein IK150_07115 [Lachnospiraceae bacterium]|nr:hypothetical protein [Lachnospiraceae bacterium]